MVKYKKYLSLACGALMIGSAIQPVQAVSPEDCGTMLFAGGITAGLLILPAVSAVSFVGSIICLYTAGKDAGAGQSSTKKKFAACVLAGLGIATAIGSVLMFSSVPNFSYRK